VRFWISGPRIFGARPGISVSPNEFKNKTPAQQPASALRVHSHMSPIAKTTIWSRSAAQRTHVQESLRFGKRLLSPSNMLSLASRQARESILKKKPAHFWNLTSATAVGVTSPPELAASAILGAAAKLGQPMRSIEERSVEQVLALAANAGNSTEHARPPWGFLNCLGFLFALSFYYVIGVFLLLAIYKDQPYDDVPINMNVSVNFLISSILAYFSARPRRIG
jgi:hypothetical protein